MKKTAQKNQMNDRMLHWLADYCYKCGDNIVWFGGLCDDCKEEKMIKGYACRSTSSDTVCIATGTKMPDMNEKGWFWHVPGWFERVNIRTFKRHFGFGIKPGTVELINLSISRR